MVSGGGGEHREQRHHAAGRDRAVARPEVHASLQGQPRRGQQPRARAERHQLQRGKGAQLHLGPPHLLQVQAPERESVAISVNVPQGSSCGESVYPGVEGSVLS